MSLARSGQYEVHIIGYPSSTPIGEPNVHFYALARFKRISIGRIGARLKALQIIIKVKPELLIVTTHELLGVAILIRILFGSKIIYDILENYGRNILFTNAFPKLIRPVIAFFVRLKERAAAPFFSQFLLAEKCYANELAFIKNKFTVIENKCKVPHDFHRKPTKDFIDLVFTGTLSKRTGVFQGITIAKRLHSVEPKVRLNIIGFCAQPNEFQKIKNEISKDDFITLTGGNELVSHSSIMNAIATANFGIIYYPVSPHTENRIPTKLYEYLACLLPILLQNHTPWTELSGPFDATITINFEQPEIESILTQIATRSFYSNPSLAQVREDLNPGQSTISDTLTWQSEEKKLLNIIHNIF